MPISPNRVGWVRRLTASTRPLHVHNELHTAASASAVWSWLVWAPRWPEWYAAAPAIAYLNQLTPELRATSVFRWQTLGTTVTASVTEYVPGRCLAWVVKGPGVRVYHRWLVRETATGCQLITEQVHTGWRGVMREWLRPHSVFAHQHGWLVLLHRQATQATLPSIAAASLPRRGQAIPG